MQLPELDVLNCEWGATDSLVTRNANVVVADNAWEFGYLLSNDHIDSRIRHTTSDELSLIAIGNPHVLHLIAGLIHQTRLRRVVFCDFNPWQLHHLQRMGTTLIESNDRFEFLQNIFCLKLNDRIRQQLTTLDRPEPFLVKPKWNERKRRQQIEAELWTQGRFDETQFQRQYQCPTRPNVTDKGLHLAIPNAGDISEYLLSVARVDRRRNDPYIFSFFWGQGYLANEDVFQSMRHQLQNLTVSFVVGDICRTLPKLFEILRYEPIALWNSNVFKVHFTRQHLSLLKCYESIARFATQRAPSYPELDMLIFNDLRAKLEIPKSARPLGKLRRRPLSNHSRTFRQVARQLNGEPGLEIVNVQDWIDQDGGVSKLPGLDYCHVDQLDDRLVSSEFGILFFHILRGHGMPGDEWASALRKGVSSGAKIIVLEHFAGSNDRDIQGLGIDPNDVRTVLGEEKSLKWIPGDRSEKRNFLMVFEIPQATPVR